MINNLNTVFIWLSVVLVILLEALYPMRKLVQTRQKKGGKLTAMLYKIMRKTHSTLGIIVIPVVFMHCRLAKMATGESSAIGGCMLLLLISLAFSRSIKKLLGLKWMIIHRFLAIALVLLTFYHSIVEFCS